MGDQGGTKEISGCSCEAWWSQEFLEKQIEGRKSKEKNSHDSFHRVTLKGLFFKLFFIGARLLYNVELVSTL